MYESRRQPLLSRRRFAHRMVGHAAFVLLLLGGSLGIGMLGYHGFEGLRWLDSFLNASMLLGGMGPIHVPVTDAGKWFAGCYALYAGLVFVAATALLVAPLLHRILHRMHFDDGDEGAGAAHQRKRSED